MASHLLARGRGQRLSAERLAADVRLDDDVVADILEVAIRSDVRLIEQVPQVRCPNCDGRVDLPPLIAAEQSEGEAPCPDCERVIDNPSSLPYELRYRLSAEADAEAASYQAAERAKPTMRAVILCALLDELRQVREQMAAHGTVAVKTIKGGQVYLTARVRGEHVTWDVHAAFTEQTNSAAAASLTNAINAFSPQLALFVGVAGGIREKGPEVGDVVAATTVFEYDIGKATAQGYEPRARQLQSSFDLKQLAGHIALADQWRDRIIPSVPELASARVFKTYLEPIAAGGILVASTSTATYELVRRTAPRAVAVEMEGAGFLGAVHLFQGVSGLVVRGVSDLLDDKDLTDREGWQHQAAANAAAFAFELLNRFQPHLGVPLSP